MASKTTKMSNQLYFINHFDGIKPFCGENAQMVTAPLLIYAHEVGGLNEKRCKNNSFILSQSNINEFLTKNNLCENLIIQGKLDLLHHQFERNEVMGNAAFNVGVNVIAYCITVSIVIFISNLLFKITLLVLRRYTIKSA